MNASPQSFSSASPGPLVAIGRVVSRYPQPGSAPHQNFLGAAAAELAFDPAVAVGLADLRVGEEVIVLTWLDRARRDELQTRPQDNPALPLTGVFSTRSPHRPNPIGLHRVRITALASPTRIVVDRLEAIDGTPILDLKPVLARSDDR